MKKIIYFLSTIILLLLCQSCSTPRNLTTIKPKNNEPTFFVRGTKVVNKKIDSIELNVSYLSQNENEVVFEIDVFNTSDKELLVDPSKFEINYLSGKMNVSHFAINPEEKIETIKLDLLKRESDNKNTTTLLIIGTVAAATATTIAVASNPTPSNNNLVTNNYIDNSYPYNNYNVKARLPGEDPLFNNELLDFWSYDALRITHLLPGQGIKGKVVFPFEKLYSNLNLGINFKDKKSIIEFYIETKIVK